VVDADGGHLLSIHDQEGYNKLAAMVEGYTGPVMIGGYSDGGGRWEWIDESTFDTEFLKAHSGDMIEGITENKLVFNWADYNADSSNGIHDWGTVNDGVPFAFACSTGTLEYIGCFEDEADKDGDGTIDCENDADGNGIADGSEYDVVGKPADCRDLNGKHFTMGTESSNIICAELCAGYDYFSMQYGNHCFCDNTPSAEKRAPESECDMPW
jgi:hypothetical protein